MGLQRQALWKWKGKGDAGTFLRCAIENEMKVPSEKIKLVIIAPTCFYYQAPIYRSLALHPRLELIVYFCSDEALTGGDVMAKFNTDKQWGVEDSMLSGYEYQFLKNYSPSPSYLKWPFGLLNLGIWGEIESRRPHLVVLMSWMNPTWWTAIAACLRYRIPFFYLTDQNIEIESSKTKWLHWTKKVLLGMGLFRITSGFLCAGTSNMNLYEYYGVPPVKLIPFAYSWGYESLLRIAPEYIGRRFELRREFGIPPDSRVFMYCGRLSSEKNPAQLLEAYDRLDSNKKTLIIVGDGNQRSQLEEYVATHRLTAVHFLGFQDRTVLPKCYAIADALVLPSLRETWGMVVNEAMCFSLPILVSSQVGAGRDLVVEGYNGFKFPAGDREGLTRSLQRILDLSSSEQTRMGARSREILASWSRRDLAEDLVGYFDENFQQSERAGNTAA